MFWTQHSGLGWGWLTALQCKPKSKAIESTHAQLTGQTHVCLVRFSRDVKQHNLAVYINFRFGALSSVVVVGLRWIFPFHVIRTKNNSRSQNGKCFFRCFLRVRHTQNRRERNVNFRWFLFFSPISNFSLAASSSSSNFNRKPVEALTFDEWLSRHRPIEDHWPVWLLVFHFMCHFFWSVFFCLLGLSSCVVNIIFAFVIHRAELSSTFNMLFVFFCIYIAAQHMPHVSLLQPMLLCVAPRSSRRLSLPLRPNSQTICNVTSASLDRQ